MRQTREEEIAERMMNAQEKTEEQRRKHSLHAQMHPELQANQHEDAEPAHPLSFAKARRWMQASVETDTEDNSPVTDKAPQRPFNDSDKNDQHREEDHPPLSNPRSKKDDPPLCLEKREGGYSCTPPSEFACEEVATSTIYLRAPASMSTGRRAPRSRRMKNIAVWSGDEVRIIDAEISPMCLSHDQRPHRYAY